MLFRCNQKSSNKRVELLTHSHKSLCVFKKAKEMKEFLEII